MTNFLRMVPVLIAAASFLYFGCQRGPTSLEEQRDPETPPDSTNQDRPIPDVVGDWQFLGLEGKAVYQLLLSGQYLYATVGKYGLFRLNLDSVETGWEYLGFAVDTTFPSDKIYRVTSVYIDESTGVILVGIHTSQLAGTGLFRSEDGGLTWVPSDSGIATDEYPWSSSVRMLNGSSSPINVVLAGIIGAIYRSQDRGRFWELVWGNRTGSTSIGAITFAASAPRMVWAGGQSGYMMPRLLRSTDGGESWIEISLFTYVGLEELDNAIHDIAIDPVDDRTVYLAMRYLIKKTDDSGETWQNILEARSGFYALAINPDNPEEILATGSGLYRTTDGGETWQRILPPVGLRALGGSLAVDWATRTVYASAWEPGKGVNKLILDN